MSLLGAFVLARRETFSGLAVAQLAAFGTVSGMIFGFHWGAAGLALVCAGVGMFMLHPLARKSSVPPEVWVACLYVLGAGLAVLLLAKAPHGEADAMGLFFGNVLSLGAAEVWESAGVLVLTLGAMGFWFHKWFWISFDSVSAGVAGLPVGRFNRLFLGLFGLAMTFSIHILGVLLAFSYLVFPAAISFLLMRRVRGVFLLIPLVSIAATAAGYYFSFLWDLPTGPFIACLLAMALLAARLAKSKPATSRIKIPERV